MLIFCLAGPSGLVRLQQYIFATAIALVLTLTVFIFVPAGGIYTFLNISPDEFANLAPVMTTDQIVRLDALRSGEHTLVTELAGLVTFLSFHAAWAVLFMWGFYPIRLLRHGTIVLNLFVIATTPVQGAHYFIDLVGGIIVAVAAIYVAIRCMDGRERALPRTREASSREPSSSEIGTPARSLGDACL